MNAKKHSYKIPFAFDLNAFEFDPNAFAFDPNAFALAMHAFDSTAAHLHLHLIRLLHFHLNAPARI